MLANCLLLQKKSVATRRSSDLVLAARTKEPGKGHPDTALAASNLADVMYYQGKYAQAEPLYPDALAIRTKKLGKDHTATVACREMLANCLFIQTKDAEAEALHR